MVLTHSVELSLHTLLTAMSRAGCGEPHQIFAGGLRYIPPSSATQVDRAAFDELRGLGLTSGSHLADHFEETLHILGRPHTEYYAHIRTDDEQYGAMVATRGRSAVSALCQDEKVWLNPAPDSDHAATLLSSLPDYSPARFRPFSVPQNDFAPNDNDTEIYETVRNTGARQLDEIFDQPYYGLGYLYTARRPDGGRRQLAADSLTYLDIDAGRIGIELIGAAGNQYINVFPGEPPTLARKLTQLNTSLDG